VDEDNAGRLNYKSSRKRWRINQLGRGIISRAYGTSTRFCLLTRG